MSRIDEIKKRRTFAIISHPDAGKRLVPLREKQPQNMRYLTGWILRKKEVFP